MNRATQRPLIIRILTSWLLWTVLVVVLLGLIASWSSTSFSNNMASSQAQFVADNVRRSAVQCYAIEGQFPSTEVGIRYLEENYGLAIDHERYLVYYENIFGNHIPQIYVVAANASSGELTRPSDDLTNVSNGGKE